MEAGGNPNPSPNPNPITLTITLTLILALALALALALTRPSSAFGHALAAELHTLKHDFGRLGLGVRVRVWA